MHSHHQECATPNNHARIESREHWLMEVPEYLTRATKHWTKLQTIAMVRRTRQVGEKISEETHYYISSLPLGAGAKSIAKAIRSHWAVENELHWSLDVAFREDASQVRKDEGPANLACIRRLALTQLKRETSLKVGIKNKRSRAGWDPVYMQTVLRTGVLSISVRLPCAYCTGSGFGSVGAGRRPGAHALRFLKSPPTSAPFPPFVAGYGG